MGHEEERLNLVSTQNKDNGLQNKENDLRTECNNPNEPALEKDNIGHMGSLTADEAEDAYRAKQKLDSNTVIQDLKFKPHSASRLKIPLCRMIQMPKVRPVLVSDVRRLESEFVHGYREGDRVFYVSTTDDSGTSQLVTDEIMQAWDAHWSIVNAAFERELMSNEHWRELSGYMFYIWDGNHRHQAWNDYILRFHSTDENWHYCVDSILLTSKGRHGVLLNAMNDINR